MLVFVWYVLIFYIFCFFFLFFLPYGKWSFNFGVWDFLNFTLNFNFDVFIFLFVLFFISFMVFLYGSFYMTNVIRLLYFFLVLFSFVLSMGGLVIFSGSVFLTLVFWDFLGISSFFLVLFYNNMISRSGSMSTVFTNRIGDFCIFIFFNGLFLCSSSYLNYQFFYSLVVFMFFLSAFIKGGQYPFGSWLPKAMAAPTPVSCLVHSSTLVAAGVMLMDFYFYVSVNYSSLVFIFFVGYFTMMFSSFCGLFEQDVKKLVALSTMSQMGFCFMSIGCGLHYVSFLHLISHSFFKSLLFTQVGYLIYFNMGMQDRRGYSLGNFCFPFFCRFQILFCLFNLCGLIFTSGFFSKDYIISSFYYYSYNFFLFFFYFLGIFLTFCYCYRMFSVFFISNYSVNFFYGMNFYYYLSTFFLFFFSLFFIYYILNNYFLFFIFFSYFEYLFWLFYIFFLLMFLKFFFNYIFFEFKYKFFMDVYSYLVYKLFPNLKYFDYFVFSFNYFIFSLFNFLFFVFFSFTRGIFPFSFFLCFFLIFFLFF
uniref:NADH dehydrogenase subunit 5 n=1 Tax=Metathelazia capsulata TaxID=2964486 RepID=UPI002E7A1714|nr:NADH dehydrogenase subunit 5 [Metathelazia capsulata]WPS93539.1 NADH dehydrogenase subunit 5 [Metathelazia capsulata]